MPAQPVTLKERLQSETTAAMRSGDSLRRDTLRMVQNSAYNLEKKSGKPLTEDELLAVVSREVKTRRESVEAFRTGGREDLATKEEAEIAILGEFLPEQLGEPEIRDLIDQAVKATGAETPRDLGKVMGWLAPHTRGRADGKLVSTLVAARLAGAG
ncbi:MAG TPA: GatB/YqeY domain-containing protein [Candidatus Limnocylindrales bacterium]|nr:GatB/YqeY domain-containing protein [Candidatus Limnocylindrales bacterium]